MMTVALILSVFFAVLVLALLIAYLRAIVYELKALKSVVHTAFYDKIVSAKQKFALEQERQLKDQRHFGGRA